MRHDPVQYITGEQEFYGLALQVSPAVLIPRPETEHLVEAVLKLLPADQPLQIADVGTGSGAIAIALAIHLPHARITAFDISLDALTVAKTNAVKHKVANRITLLHSDLLNAEGPETPWEVGLAEKAFDAVVSNPPYIPEADRDILHPQVAGKRALCWRNRAG
jgi:release factor glutamine methyltransferase